MSISGIYESGIQKSNVAHFAGIANIAFIDEELFSKILKNPKKYAM